MGLQIMSDLDGNGLPYVRGGSDIFLSHYLSFNQTKQVIVGTVTVPALDLFPSRLRCQLPLWKQIQVSSSVRPSVLNSSLLTSQSSPRQQWRTQHLIKTRAKIQRPKFGGQKYRIYNMIMNYKVIVSIQ